MKDALNKQKLYQQKIDNRRHIVVKMKSAVRHLLNILKVVGKERVGEVIAKGGNLKGLVEGNGMFK